MRKTLLCTAALVGGFTIASHGQTWDGDTSTDFADGDNWVGGTAPNGTAPMIINNVSDGTAFAPILTTSYTLDPDGGGGDGYVGSGAGASGTLDINSGGTLDGGGNWFFIGENGGSGTVNVNSGGLLTSDNDVRLGAGSLVVNDGGTVSVGRIVGGGTTSVEVNGTGSLTTTIASDVNGSPDVQNLTTDSLAAGGLVSGARNISFASGSSTITGGSLVAGSEIYVGNGVGSNVNLTVSAGSVTSNAWIAVGRNGSTGVLNIDGGTIVQNTEFLPLGSDLGAGAGDGTVNQTAGSVTTPSVRLGENGSSVGTYSISGGTLDAGAGAFEIGFNATTTGTLNVTSTGSVTSTGTTFVGKLGTATGLLNVEGSGATISLGELAVGLDDLLADSGATGTINFLADSSGISSITVGGDVNLSSTDGDFLTVDLSALAGTGTGTIDLLLIDGATSQGEFTGLTQGATVSGALGGTIDYSEAGNVWIRGVQIPEPSVALLGGLGFLALLRRRRQS